MVRSSPCRQVFSLKATSPQAPGEELTKQNGTHPEVAIDLQIGGYGKDRLRERAQAADGVVDGRAEGAAVLVIDQPAVGIGDADRPAVVDAEGHLCSRAC